MRRNAGNGYLGLAILLLFLGFVALAVIGPVLDWLGEAKQVAREEFGPRELLRKYEWFKDASAALDEKKANIVVYEKRRDHLVMLYECEPRSKWPRDDREAYNQIVAELAGLKAAFNGLAAEYNAQMAKFNWRFTNAGDLPKGADRPLPREYKPYILD